MATKSFVDGVSAGLVLEDAEFSVLASSEMVDGVEVATALDSGFAGRRPEAGADARAVFIVAASTVAMVVEEDGADPMLIDIEAIDRLEVIAELELDIVDVGICISTVPKSPAISEGLGVCIVVSMCRVLECAAFSLLVDTEDIDRAC